MHLGFAAIIYGSAVCYTTCGARSFSFVQVSKSAARSSSSSMTSRTTGAESIDVAVVGSGPLSDHDRALIPSAKELYRFNSMPNMNMNERVGTVFLRRAGYSGDKIWGMKGASGACPRITEASGLVLIAKGQGSPISEQKLQELKNQFGGQVIVSDQSSQQLTMYGHTYHSNAEKPNALFSTGFVGLSHVLHHSPLALNGSKVHVFGMNWKKESIHSGGHPFGLEKQAVYEHPQITVHETTEYFYKPHDESGKMRWTCEHNATAEKLLEVEDLFELAMTCCM